MQVVSIALGSVTLPDEDAEMIKQAQRTAIMRDPTMAAATLVGAQADAMKTAAGNQAGAMTGFMGMGMAMNAGGGMNAQNLFAMGQQQQQAQQQAPATPAAPVADGWKCACGATVSGNFCPNCGAKKTRVHRFTTAISAAGSRRILPIRPSSALNVAMYSTIMTENETAA